MRLLHTSDWHLGKTTDGVSRRPDHEAIAAEIAAIARDLRPDLILHTGDLFDVSMPAVEDLRLGIEMLEELAAIAPVAVLCGNHENPKLFALFDRLRGSERMRFIDRPRAPANGGILHYPTRDGERIRLASLPFVRNSTYVAEFRDPALWTSVYGDNLAFVERTFDEALAQSDFSRDIALFAAHVHVTGAVLARSEREVHIDDYATRPEAIPSVTYAAFGHIHKPQEIAGRPWARYAGSPIPIDFGEIDERKSIVFVEAKPGVNPYPPRLVELSGGRPLRRMQGTLESLAARAVESAGSLARVIVEHAGSPSALYDRVADVLPGTTLLRVDILDPNRQIAAVEPLAGGEEPDLATMFDAYLAAEGAPADDNEQLREVFEDAMKALRGGATMSFPELEERTA